LQILSVTLSHLRDSSDNSHSFRVTSSLCLLDYHSYPPKMTVTHVRLLSQPNSQHEHTLYVVIISWPSRARVRLEFGNFFQISKFQISKLFEFRIKIEFSRTTRALRTFIRTPYPHPLFLRVTYVLSTTVRCMLHATGASPL
jgi:hypothetical protein